MAITFQVSKVKRAVAPLLMPHIAAVSPPRPVEPVQ